MFVSNFCTKFARFSSVIALLSVCLVPLHVSADTVARSDIHFNPDCVNATAGTAFWDFQNNDATPTVMNWHDTVNPSINGTLTIAVGDSVVSTSNYIANTNNTTTFNWDNGLSDATLNSANTPCAPIVAPTPPVSNPVVTPCIDGTNAQNLVVTIDHGIATIHTLNNAPLCTDITLNFSSYTMPADYNDAGFSATNTTSYPQPEFDHTVATLHAGTDGSTTMQINLPNSCNNIQVDVYYDAEITTVGPNGHGTQNILSAVYLADGTSCVCPPVAPVTPIVLPTTPVTPVVPTAPVIVPTNPVIGGKGGDTDTTTTTPAPVSSTPVATTLSNTGFPVWLSVASALTLITTAVAVARPRSYSRD